MLLADILPTGYEVGVLNGHVQPGDVVAVVGAGPVGLAAIMGAPLFSPSHIVAIDLAQSRLEAAKMFGADVVVNNTSQDARDLPRAHRWSRCRRRDRSGRRAGLVRTHHRPSRAPGGHVANIGVHGTPATLHLEALWARDVTITTGLVDTSSTPTLLETRAGASAVPPRFVTTPYLLGIHRATTRILPTPVLSSVINSDWGGEALPQALPGFRRTEVVDFVLPDVWRPELLTSGPHTPGSQ